MFDRYSIGAIVLAAAMGATIAVARAYDESKYSDLKGQWVSVGVGPDAPWDPTKPAGRGQQAPLTPEYHAIFEAMLAAAAEGGRTPVPCIPPGMPRTMIVYEPMEIIVTPYATYMALGHMSEFRRIFTNGRKWSREIEPAYAGFSTGTWEDTDGDGRYDTLAVETRGMKGPRTFDSSGIPLHRDNQTVVKERISLDKADSNLLHDEITTIDNALTRPWTVKRSYRRKRDAQWSESVCPEGNRYVAIGTETYAVSNDGYLTPTRKLQPAPDLQHFPNRK
jgi:hypothetical protein